jgi:hypothetical protein
MRAPWNRHAVVVVVLLALSGCGGSAGEELDAPRPAGTVGVGPTEVVRGVPRGWRHDDQGARAAALAYVALSDDVARAGFITRGDLIGALAAPGYRQELEAETIDQLDGTLDALVDQDVSPGQLLWSELPLTARVVAGGPEGAQVEVWSVVVIGIPTAAAVPRQTWRTVTVDLVWVEGDWLVSGWSAAPGPTPALGPDAVIDPVDDLATVVAWPPAHEGEV